MTIDASLGPTPERLRRSKWLSPETTRETQRVAWRSLDVFERLHKAGELEFSQLRAAEQFRAHWEGHLRVEVRMSDEVGQGGGKGAEIPQHRHGREVAYMRSHLPPRQFSALVLLTESADCVAEVGRLLCRRRNKPQAYAAGLAVVQEALAGVALLYGLTSRAHPPSR
jgi:hypothetical protein